MFEPKGRVRAGAWAKKRMQRAENTACFHTHLIKTERTVEMYEWVANDYLTVSIGGNPLPSGGGRSLVVL
ncbi:hypothetical protein CXIVA_06910 [Clostridium sp. SY8519]|nr:hypothetical protein CXIVA_06910 [Clostridium sp. SY8519]